MGEREKEMSRRERGLEPVKEKERKRDIIVTMSGRE